VDKKKGWTMSQNVTLLATISATQGLALEALLKGASVTKAANEAGVARETVSRWVHHDPAFLAELQNARAELALQTRCALESLGMRAIGVLVEAMQNQFMQPWRFRAACASLKLIGADKAETIPSTTREEVQLALQEREGALQARQAKLRPSEAKNLQPVEVVEPAPDLTEQAAPAAASGSEPAGANPTGNGGLGQAMIDTFLKSVEDRVKQAERVSVLPISIEPCPLPGRASARKGKAQRPAIAR
jgi:hypothetical protein